MELNGGTALELQERVSRVRQKVVAAGKCLNPPLDQATVRAFEERHGARLPEEYREFLLRVGNGGMDGPPFYGLEPFRPGPWQEGDHARRYWVDLPDLARPFPFTGPWIREGEAPEELTAGSDQSLADRISHGCLLLGTDGCGIDWILVVSGPDRGVVWYRTSAGLLPTSSKRDFLRWIEDWLDGTDPEAMVG